MSFARSKKINASRKERICDHCRQAIGLGEPYLYVAWVGDEGFDDCHVHAECHAFVTNYTCTDEGFGYLVDFDPSDEYELADEILAKPPSAAMLARLPANWRAAGGAILIDATTGSGRLL